MDGGCGPSHMVFNSVADQNLPLVGNRCGEGQYHAQG